MVAHRRSYRKIKTVVYRFLGHSVYSIPVLLLCTVVVVAVAVVVDATYMSDTTGLNCMDDILDYL